MSIFFSPIESVKSFIGIVEVKEQNGIVTISGVRSQNVLKDIKRLFKSNRISDHMILKDTHSTLSFYSFFLPDILFIITQLLKKNTLTSKRTLSKVREALIENTYLRSVETIPNRKLDINRLNDFVFTPKDFQEEFFDKYDRLTQQYNLRGYLFAAAPGAGKTYSALALAYCLNPEKIVIIAPKNSINRVWEDSIKNVIKNTPKYYISDNHHQLHSDCFIEVHHYERVSTLKDRLAEYRNKRVVVILDESHNFNELTSDRTIQFADFCLSIDCKNTILLSGTPIKAMAREAIPLFRVIDPLFTMDVENAFKKVFRGDAGRATEILNNRLGLVSLVVPKERLGLSDPIIKSYPVKLDKSEEFTLDSIKKQMTKFIEERMKYYASRRKGDETYFFSVLDRVEKLLDRNQRKEHEIYLKTLRILMKTTDYSSAVEEMAYCNRYEKNVIAPLLDQSDKNKFKDVKSIVKYTLLKVRGECLGTIVGGARQRCFEAIAKNIDYKYFTETTEKKTIVFTSYISSLEAARDKSINDGLFPVMIYGGTNSKLNELIREFEKDDNQNPLIATFDSLSTAVPLVMCDVMVMINVPFRDYMMQQAISRIHRLGADTQTYVYTAFLDTGTKPNISTRSKDILEWSAGEVEKIIGIKSPFANLDEDSVKLAVEGEDFTLPTSMTWS